MTERVSARTFRKGLEAVRRKRYLEGLAYFEAALRIEARAGARAPMPYLSHYGLCLAFASGRVAEARTICERAVLTEFFNPDLYVNLGYVCLHAGDRRAAFSAFVKGLQLNPRHTALSRAVRRMGLRTRPVLRFLDRRHPLNRLLGRVRRTAGRSFVPRGGRPAVNRQEAGRTRRAVS